MTGSVTSKDISAAALQVFSPDEIKAMPEQTGLTLAALLRKRLEQKGPAPTLEKLQGIKELVVEHLWHPTLTTIAKGRE